MYLFLYLPVNKNETYRIFIFQITSNPRKEQNEAYRKLFTKSSRHQKVLQVLIRPRSNRRGICEILALDIPLLVKTSANCFFPISHGKFTSPFYTISLSVAISTLSCLSGIKLVVLMALKKNLVSVSNSIATVATKTSSISFRLIQMLSRASTTDRISTAKLDLTIIINL